MEPGDGNLEWERTERRLNAAELGYLSKNAVKFAELMRQYGVQQAAELPTPAELDELYSRWCKDDSPSKTSRQVMIETLGITFGNYLCEHRQMHWVELSDSLGTTYAVRHYNPDVFAFPIDSTRKHMRLGSHSFFALIDRATAEELCSALK